MVSKEVLQDRPAPKTTAIHISDMKRDHQSTKGDADMLTEIVLPIISKAKQEEELSDFNETVRLQIAQIILGKLSNRSKRSVEGPGSAKQNRNYFQNHNY